MSKLIKVCKVPELLRKSAEVSPEFLKFYDDHISTEGGQSGTWFFKDIEGLIIIDEANVRNHCSSVIFSRKTKSDEPIIQDSDRIIFSTGKYSIVYANEYAKSVADAILLFLDIYRSKQ